MLGSIFSNLYYPDLQSQKQNTYLLEDEQKLKASQDHKRMMKKAKLVDVKLLKAKIKDSKKIKNDELQIASKRNHSDLSSIVKKITKFPQPHKILRKKILESFELDNKGVEIKKGTKELLNLNIFLAESICCDPNNKLRRNSTL